MCIYILSNQFLIIQPANAAPISSSVLPALTAASTNPAEIDSLSLSSKRLWGISIPNFSPKAVILSFCSWVWLDSAGAAAASASSSAAGSVGAS
jgi:hypothetical protein